ncbi:type II toxin-antitoxin system VapC family toxin [Brevundimonas sp.]
MRAYLDASVIVPLFLHEDSSERMLQWLATDVSIALSDWSVAEVSSALSLHVRRENLDPEERDAAETAMNAWLDGGAFPIEVVGSDVTEARLLLHRHPKLRTPDALHLAIVHRLECALVTYGEDLASAAERDGIVVIAP